MRLATVHAVCLICAISILPGASIAKAKTQEAPDELRILGWVEKVRLVEPDFELKAKLDTGARTSSLDVRIIKKFRQYGKRWVRFAVLDPESGEETVMVRERERTIGIVQHEGENDVRPTVKVEVCIAGEQREIEVSLVDRSRFEYPMLLGRRVLSRFALVDAAETFLSHAHCDESENNEKDDEVDSKKEQGGENASRDETAGAGNVAAGLGFGTTTSSWRPGQGDAV